ncbi:MAG: hypothetical protein PW789_09390 [Edaphobacter sp.]|uniref:hypothetical protein n=1 Tax=Edaphobacter sp. TaxID=1934404 RepID=UPI0023A3147F|nr:hypothetical protein [Edaphobacter sp.]MDE1176808.1 hypothetical protein [Edaphobacter sp.]
MAAVVSLLLLVVLLSAVSHSPAAVCCLVLVPVFLFALLELPSCETAEEPERATGFDDASPSLFQRPPPSLA